ncbi:MAG: hypothetical protein EYC62_02485 [Alphaproteobacteria bacterium]|nr:MAG: hypothetical protein EYC62_02485 [Alphaproteobacteria bacterium]
MPITTAGSSNVVTGTFTNSVSTANGIGSGGISVFTTPNTANAIFIVNYQVTASTASTNNLNHAAITIPGALGYSSSGSTGSAVGIQIDGTNERSAASGVFKCGPNTALSLAVTCKNAGAASAATFAYRIQYDYVSIVVS